jgi:ATP-dependent helicase/nuclease subunit B
MSRSQTTTIIRAACAADRIRAAHDFLAAVGPASEALVIADNPAAADDLVRAIASERGAAFGIHRVTLNRLIFMLASARMAALDVSPVTRFGEVAIAARAVFSIRARGENSYFDSVMNHPGFAEAIAATRRDLTLNRLGPAELERLDTAGASHVASDVTLNRPRPHELDHLDTAKASFAANRLGPGELEHLETAGASLAAILHQFDRELAEANLIDRAAMIDHAIDALGEASAAPFGGIPTLLFDVPIENLCERDFVAALAARAPRFLATIPAGDERSSDLIARALDVEATSVNKAGAVTADAASLSEATSLEGASLNEAEAVAAEATSLVRLQEYLFAETAPPERALDDTVMVFSAAGEMQECVEIARRIQAEASGGVPFDRIAIVLHGPSRYAPYLEEALDRAGVPAYFARSASRPEPGGRALLALLGCAAENLSARRFAEYLSLAQVPDAAAARDASDADFVPPTGEFGIGRVSDELDAANAAPSRNEDPNPAVARGARAPWRWEKLLIDAAVIGSRARWDRRLDGLEAEIRLRRSDLEDDDGAQAGFLDRQLADLEHLRTIAMPLIDALAALPKLATWSEWLAHLRALIAIAIIDRDHVTGQLAELDLLGPIGPVTLDEIRLVLGERLGRLAERPTRRRYGAVYVAPAEYIRAMDFDVTFVPGLVERVFPKKLVEDPMLPDAARRRLSPALPLQADRVAGERLALRIAVGAARRRTILSYPRVDLDQGRPRVPSFYALEIFRAAEGSLPGFEELAKRAAGDRPARLGWPAPERPADAIDEAEFDLAVLDKLVDADPAATVGAAHYLLGANPHLGRALRARARRWLRRWTPNDGLVDPDADERAALARHQLSARSYSPTALQNFAACPYRFFLQAIHRLAPREEIDGIEVIDPLTRGALFHEVQFEILTTLRNSGGLPITRESLADAHLTLDTTLAAVAAEYHDKLAPAIERVWLDGIDSIRADLREWLRRTAEDSARWRPERFELGFGLTDRAHADPASVAAPIDLEVGLTVRGSIDLVERGADNSLRVTDHKTGRVRADRDVIIGGGKTLQPVLYALAAERILGQPIEEGRLYYCTAAGGYEERVVTIDAAARAAMADCTAIIGKALADGFLPAAPGERECDYCDYRRVCGPYENTRVEYKAAAKSVSDRLVELKRLRELR